MYNNTYVIVHTCVWVCVYLSLHVKNRFTLYIYTQNNTIILFGIVDIKFRGVGGGGGGGRGSA